MTSYGWLLAGAAFGFLLDRSSPVSWIELAVCVPLWIANTIMVGALLALARSGVAEWWCDRVQRPSPLPVAKVVRR